MTLRKLFITLTALAALLAVVALTLLVETYHSRLPLADRLFYRGDSAHEDDPYWRYKGLRPSADEPSGTYYRNRVLVLMYHDVSPNPTDIRSLTTANLDKQLGLMARNNFHWITMDQYRAFILHGAKVPDNAVLLTFDDGYESFYQYAYPILEKYRAPASNFLIVGTIGNPKAPGVPKLNWEQVKTMHEAGYDFYNHTYNSHDYAAAEPNGKERIPQLYGRLYLKDKGRRETEAEYETRVEADLRHANEVLKQELGADNHVLAFPYGGFTKAVLRICDKLGIDVTLTVSPGLNKPGDRNGFRLNAGGMKNDPDLQLALMKQAPKRIGHGHFDRAPERRKEALAALALLVIIGALWLWTGRKLLLRRRHRRLG